MSDNEERASYLKRKAKQAALGINKFHDSVYSIVDNYGEQVTLTAVADINELIDDSYGEFYIYPTHDPDSTSPMSAITKHIESVFNGNVESRLMEKSVNRIVEAADSYITESVDASVEYIIHDVRMSVLENLTEMLDGVKRIESFVNVLVTSLNINVLDTTVTVHGITDETVTLQEQILRFGKLKENLSNEIYTLAGQLDENNGTV